MTLAAKQPMSASSMKLLTLPKSMNRILYLCKQNISENCGSSMVFYTLMPSVDREIFNSQSRVTSPVAAHNKHPGHTNRPDLHCCFNDLNQLQGGLGKMLDFQGQPCRLSI